MDRPRRARPSHHSSAHLGPDSRPDSSSDADSSPDPTPRPRRQPRLGRQNTDRAVIGAVRVFLTLILLCTLAIGAFLAGPTIVEELDTYANPITVEQPPPAGERSPDTVDPDDPGTSTYEGSHTTFSSADVEDFVHLKVNEERAEHDLEDLEWDGTVASVSRAHSVDMYEREYFAHDNLDGEGPFDRFQDVSNYCRGYGENIAMTWADRRVQPEGGDVEQYRTPEELADGLVEQWMNSPPHREAILEDSWDRGGVGVYLSEDGAVYATHNFCMEF